MANLLSANPMPRSVFAYHSVTLVPALIIAAAYGARRISLLWAWLSSAQVSGLALIASLVMGYALAPLPIPGAINFWAPARFPIAPDPVPSSIRATLGSATISVQGNIGAHFSQRSQIYAYPRKLDDVEAIVLRLKSPTRRLFPKEPGDSFASLASHLQMRPEKYLASVECLLSHGSFKVALWQDPWLVLRRGADTATTDTSVDSRIQQKLQQLRVEWQVEVEDYREALQKCGRT